jgi:cell division septation protein DedD
LVTPAPAPAPETAKAAKEERYTLVIATYANQKQAQAMQQRLRTQNLKAKVITSKTGGKTLYQVQVGPVIGLKTAEEAAAKIKNQEKIAPKMIKITAKPAAPAKAKSPAKPKAPAKPNNSQTTARPAR